MRYLALILLMATTVSAQTPTAEPISIRTNFAAGDPAQQFTAYCDLLRADPVIRKPSMTDKECWRRFGIRGARGYAEERANVTRRMLRSQRLRADKAKRALEDTALSLPDSGPQPTSTPTASPSMTATPTSTATATATP